MIGHAEQHAARRRENESLRIPHDDMPEAKENTARRNHCDRCGEQDRVAVKKPYPVESFLGQHAEKWIQQTDEEPQKRALTGHAQEMLSKVEI